MSKVSFELNRRMFDMPEGTIVYPFYKCTYGIVSDDMAMDKLGREHIAVTEDPNGDYPFYSVPVDCLEETWRI